jgi:hypothetical protein
MSNVFKLPHQFSVITAVGLILFAGLPQICCAITSVAGQSTTACAMCHGGECCNCPCCPKNKSCPAPASGGDSSRHLPVSGVCQSTPLLAASKPVSHLASSDALLPNFDIAIGDVANLVRSQNRCHVVESPTAVEHPTLLRLSCSLLI